MFYMFLFLSSRYEKVEFSDLEISFFAFKICLKHNNLRNVIKISSKSNPYNHILSQKKLLIKNYSRNKIPENNQGNIILRPLPFPDLRFDNLFVFGC